MSGWQCRALKACCLETKGEYRNRQFMIRAYDGENMLEKRMAVRPQHLENLAKRSGDKGILKK